ncbi:ribose-phosphate diphosphokinase [Rhodanobacter terrae]|uniref:Ribose-phosphate diphosphokinase n=1 Tax=Rhodanobacter terrae TaxID=418647 RepID=A0ABW0SVR2_9GAMM
MNALYAMPGNEAFAELLSLHTGYQRQELLLHHFPDGETLIQMAPPRGGDAVIVCTLDRPDPKVLPLMMAAATARELGAARVGLVAPYLAYMRQDMRFNPGEALSAKIFGDWLGHTFDWLVTVDPHLHRHTTLAEVYPNAACIVHAASQLAVWIDAHVTMPLIVGPDSESAQWVTAVSNLLCAPGVVARKERHGDRDVAVFLPEIDKWRDHTPVLVDDIIASGATMIQTLRCLQGRTSRPPVCVALHGVFTEGVLDNMRAEGAGLIATSNSIVTTASQIDISKPVAEAMVGLSVARPAEAAASA